MAGLAMFLLGAPQLERDGAPLEINRRKALALLVYLAVTAQSHSRDALATLFWPDDDQTQARAALRRTLSVLNQQVGQWLEIDREQVAFKLAPDFWLDVNQFQTLVTAPTDLVRLAEAVNLYRADFLAGFTLRDTPDFDEWQFFQTESLRRELASALERLVEGHTTRQDYETAIGYARRWLNLDPLHEPAHRHLMQLYSWSNQRAAALRQYTECVRLLKEELGLLPSPETTTLYTHICNGDLGPKFEVNRTAEDGKPISVKQTSTTRQPPTFSLYTRPRTAVPLVASSRFSALQPSSFHLPPSASPLFVARERELAQMHKLFQAALARHGQVVLIVGEAGSGKTALLHEFARQAQALYPDLITAIGNCHTHTGAGDPYLPFRELFGLLTGAGKATLTREVISQENEPSLSSLQPVAVPTLTSHNFGLLAPGQRLEAAGRGYREGNGVPQPAPTDLFEAFNQVIQTLTSQQPLLLGLEDLQWADAASLNLLFHLGRQLEGQPILLVLTYRPDDVALGRLTSAGVRERHPFEPVVNELKRRYGEIEIDLGRAMDRHFVEAFLDTEANDLGTDFRAALFRQTQGHPLFTVELLRAMQERGDVVRNAQGHWIEGRTINWNALPARVEAVIAERLGRLEPQLYEILSVASVEGQDFTAQVLARLLQLPERQLLRLLSQELEKRHQLVREIGEIRQGEQRLTLYQFSHRLFQQYLYQELGAGERRLWHGEVATALAELYAGQTEAIMVQLAYHYSEAGQSDKAINYLISAGDNARGLYAHQEAADFYQRALAFLREQGTAGRERATRTLMKLGLTYHLAFDFPLARRAYEEGFTLWQWAGKSPACLPLAPHALRLAFPGQPRTLDSSQGDDSESMYLIEQLFSGLVTLNRELDVIPEIAQSWQVLEGGQNYIFHLRDDVRWSDGWPVVAEDFVYAWRRVLHPETHSSLAGLLYDLRGGQALHRGEISDPQQVGVRALDPVTLLVELERPTGHFPQVLANAVAYPLPRHVVEAYGADWAEAGRIVTNGPFLIHNWQPGQHMTLGRNPDYRGQASGNVQQVELFLSSEISSILERYEASELDVMYLWHLLPLDKDRARQRHAGEYVFGPGMDTTYIAFNLAEPPFNDKRVRRALTMSIDRETLASVVLGGYDSPALGGFVPPNMPGHSAEIGLPYDPEQARWLLAEAGYPGGRGFPQVEWLGKLFHQPMTDYLQTQWRENLGLTLKCQTMEWDCLLDRLSRKVPHLYQMGWAADYTDPDNFLRVCLQHCLPAWANQNYIELIERARQTLDQIQRLNLYRQADRLLVEEAVIMPLTHKRQHLLVKPWVSQFPTSAIKIWFWKDVVIEPHS